MIESAWSKQAKARIYQLDDRIIMCGGIAETVKVFKIESLIPLCVEFVPKNEG